MLEVSNDTKPFFQSQDSHFRTNLSWDVAVIAAMAGDDAVKSTVPICKFYPHTMTHGSYAVAAFARQITCINQLRNEPFPMNVPS
jgi:hypothetical protein